MKPKCVKCRFYIFSCTLGSADRPIWHCRFGFSPFSGFLYTFEPPMFYDCRIEASDIIKLLKPKQLYFNFD